MSLFLGNLSPHIRREELEWVFRRFGRSNVQLKGGYGFVIYELPADAERALRALRGKNICGEQISLTWANKQPRPFQRLSRTTGFYKPYSGRNLREEANSFRNRDSHERRNFIARQPLNNRRGPQLADALDKKPGYTHEDNDNLGEEKHPNSKEALPDESGAVELNPVGIDRWGDPLSDSAGGNGAEDETDFERYEPYHGNERRDDDEDHHIDTPSSAAQRSSPEKGQREHSPKSQQICFICGLVGHKMRSCPQGDASRRDKFGRFDSRRYVEMNFGGRGEGGLKRTRATFWGSPHDGRDPSLSRRHAGDRRGFHSGKPKRLVRSKRFPESAENFRNKLRMESPGKRRRERRTPNSRLKKRRVRRSASSSLHSDSTSTSSRSNSPSSRSASGVGSRSCSRLVSSRSHSESSSSRSSSVSSYSKSSSSRSRSSLHKSLSLSISLDQKSQSPPKNVHMDAANGTFPMAEFDHLSNPGSKHLSAANLENSELGGVLKDDNATSIKVDDDISGKHLGYDDFGNFSAYESGNQEKDSCMGQQENIFSENLGEKTDNGGAQSYTENLQIPAGCRTSNSIRISPQEMCMVLKHYGVAGLEECEPGLSIEAYFGAARLWPWEMIYYRRLKKGPISTENYARRVAQNKEFAIVDKYIRSSSGWAECDRTDT